VSDEYNRWIAEADRAGDQRNYLLAAQNSLAAVAVALSPEERATAEKKALWFLQWVDAPDLKRQLCVAATAYWGERASWPILSRDERSKFGIRALSFAVYAEGENIQADYAQALIDLLETGEIDGKGRKEIELLLRREPAMAKSAKSKLWRYLAEYKLKESNKESEDYARKELVREAESLYRQAEDQAGVEQSRRELAQIYYENGRGIELIAGNQSGLLDRAKTLEKAAEAYDRFWPTETARCQDMARKYRSDAENNAIGSAGYDSARVQLDAALRSIRRGDVSPHLALSHMNGRKLQDDENLVGQFWTLRREDSGQDEIISSIATVLGIDLNVSVLKSSLSDLVMSLGDTTNYCPTPDQKPQWIVTTTWRKTLLALLVAGFSGGLAGLGAGAIDPKAALAGVVGSESAVIINLLSVYLTQPDRRGISELLKDRDEDEAVIILRLRERSRTTSELATLSGLSREIVLQKLKVLEMQMVVRSLERSAHKARQWEICKE
jgi:hypothetical protein